jgi:tRNA(Ile)-lysidine synthase
MPRGQGCAAIVAQDTAALKEKVALDFAALMAPLAPFEPQPHLAVAVSGGGDSMALVLLAHDWATERGGRVTALTVDHALRPEAAAEAAQVAAWCQERGIAHAILTRSGAAPVHGVQAFARAARYALLDDWCRDHFVLHLLLAHQSEDQAETMVMRAASGSGVDGLAGMASVVERGAVRLLRPLLDVSRAQLRECLIARSQAWIEDPSNRNPAFTRVRIRDELTQAKPGLSHAERAAMARRYGAERARREVAVAQWLARFVTLDPAGFAAIDPHAFAGPEALAPKALGGVLATISGRPYPPRSERIERLYHELASGLPRDRTLGGCLILRRREKILICREPSAVAAPIPLAPGQEVCWDGRFRVALDPRAPDELLLGALGADASMIARELAEAKEWGKSAALRLPAVVRATLPALRDAKGVVAVPSLGYFKCCRKETKTAACRVEFGPIRSLTGAGFTIV